MTNFEDSETPAQRLRRALRRFEQQEEADPACADHGLLETASQALVEFLDSGEPPDFAIARDGLTVLFRKQDAQTTAMLMLRTLDWPLSDSERAWAYHHLGNMLTCNGSAAGAVVAHNAFETWIQGKSPFLARRSPLHDPLPADSPDA